MVVGPGKTETLVLYLKQAEPPNGLGQRFPDMRGFPGGYQWLWDQPDLKRVRALWLEPIGDIPPESVENPAIVGTHWFQYGDQAVTGRGDGENYQIGFVDICDTPYAETIDATRAIGERLYERLRK